MCVEKKTFIQSILHPHNKFLLEHIFLSFHHNNESICTSLDE